MTENRNNSEILKDFTRTLRDVASVDYFATQKLIRSIFIEGFDHKVYDDDIKNAFIWISESRHKISDLSGNSVPDYVRKNRFTIGLFLEIDEETANGKTDYQRPVAFSLPSRELREDIESIKDTPWYRSKGSVLKNDDLLSFVIFLKYWGELKKRVNLLKK